MKILKFIYFAIALLSLPYFVYAENIIFNPPIPKPEISVEKAVEFARAEFNNFLGGSASKSSEYIVQSVEYCSYNDIIEKYKNYSDTEKIKQVSKEGNWEWKITFCSTIASDDYYTYMVTQNGDVLLLKVCCL
jgi:hypothetical protein